MSTINLQAWLFPGNPACSAMAEIADGRHIDTLKPQYHRLTDLGSLAQINVDGTPNTCNGYSTQNATLIRQYSTQQFITVSATIAGMVALSTSPPLLASCLNQLVTFLKTAQFTGGVEIDCEGFADWTASQYNSYKNVLGKLGQGLHNAGYKLMLDGPAITGTAYQNYYLDPVRWRYEDFNTLPVDFLCVMAYDFQDDNGEGTPVASLQNITDCCTWMLSKVSDPTRIVIGLNSYGYTGKVGTYTATNQTYQQIAQQQGFLTMTKRDASSGELMWTANNTVYDCSDVQTLNGKVQAVLNTGLTHISIWHLGGNQWPTTLQPPQPVPTPTPVDPTLAAFNAAYPGFAVFYQKHVDSEGNFIP